MGHDSIKKMEWLAYYIISFYENITYYDLIASV